MSELTMLDLYLQAEKDVKMVQSTGSLLHGFMMSKIDKDYADFLHSQAVRPYTQYIYYDRSLEKVVWRINALSEEARREILLPLQELEGSFLLEQKNMYLNILGKREHGVSSYEELVKKYFIGNRECRYIKFSFMTSTSFKSNGEYMIFPKQQLIFSSLLKRWNSFSLREKLEERQLADDLAAGTYVADYKMQLNKFALEGIFIPAFRGDYKLGLKNKIMLNKICCLLAEYAEYAGIGIKTALGMGAVKSTFMGGEK